MKEEYYSISNPSPLNQSFPQPNHQIPQISKIQINQVTLPVKEKERDPQHPKEEIKMILTSVEEIKRPSLINNSEIKSIPI